MKEGAGFFKRRRSGLGERPRKAGIGAPDGYENSAHWVDAGRGDGAGFQPRRILGDLFLGRCPRLGWGRGVASGRSSAPIVLKHCGCEKTHQPHSRGFQPRLGADPASGLSKKPG